MKTISISEEGQQLKALLEEARREDVVVRLADGSEFVLAAVDEFEHEVVRARLNDKLMAFLDRRALQERTVSLEEVKRRLGLAQ